MDTELTVLKPSTVELSKSKNQAMQEISDCNDLLEWSDEEAEGVLQIVDQPVTNKQAEYMLSKSKNQVMQEISDCNDLLEWINEEAEGVLQIVDQPVTNKHAEYLNYLGFKTEFDKRQKIFLRLEEKEVSKKAEQIIPKMWQELEPKWRSITRRTRTWLRKLDASLLDRLGIFGDWINSAEEMLEIEPENLENHIQMADQLLKLSNQHKDFFKEMDHHKEFFLQELISPQQMNSLLSRLQVICKEAPKRENLLLYNEFRFRLSGLREATEKKMEIWMSKLRTQKDVEEIVLDYKDFVHTNNLFANYDEMLKETNTRGDAFRKYFSKGELALIPVEDTQTWQTMTGQIKKLPTMFDTVLEHWKRYNMCYDMLIAWTTKGKRVLHGDKKEQIEEYFMDISHYAEKLKCLEKFAMPLKENCKEIITEEFNQNLDMLNSSFIELVEDYRYYQCMGVSRERCF